MKIEKILFYLLIFCLPFQIRKILWQVSQPFSEWTMIFLYGTDILIFLVLFLWTARGGLRKIETDKALTLSVFCFAVITLLPLLKVSNFKIGLYQWFKLLEFILLFFYVQHHFILVYKLKRIFQVLFVSALFQSLLAILQFARQASLGLKILGESPLSPNLAGVAKFFFNDSKIIRAYGTFSHSNILAAFLILALFGLVYFMRFVGVPSLMKKKELFFDQATRLKSGGAWRSLVSWFSTSPTVVWVARTAINLRFLVFSGYLFVLGLLLLALFLTFSRVIIAVGLLGIILYLFFVVKKKGLLFIFVGFCLLLVALLWPMLFVRFSTELAASQALSLRIFYSKAALEMIKSSPLFGIGWGSFVYRLSLIATGLESWAYQPVHNIYLLVASQAGIFGLVAFLWFLFLVIKKAVTCLNKTKNREIILLLFVLGFFLVIGFFDHFLLTSQQGQLMLWLVLGMLTGYDSKKELKDLSL